MLFCVVVGQKKENLPSSLRDMYDDDDVNDDVNDDDDGFSIGVKNAGRVSSSFALHVVLCIHIYIYIHIYTHTYTLRGMHTGTIIGMSRKWLCKTLCAFYALLPYVASHQSTHPRRLASASSSFWFVDGDRGCSSAGVDARGVVLAFDVVGSIAVETQAAAFFDETFF